MKKYGLLGRIFLFFMIPALCATALCAPAHSAEPVAECEIQEISRGTHVVSFSWELHVHSEKAWDVCDMTIAFFDGRGKEIHTVRERMKLNTGNNTFSGFEVMDTKTWDRIKKTVTTLDCVF